MLLRPFIISLTFSALLLSSVQAAQTCITTPVPVNGQDVNAISGSSDSYIIAVADNANGSGQISIFDGSNWVAQTDPAIPNEDFNDVLVFGVNDAIIVGDDGAVVILSDDGSGGAVWTDISISNQDYTTIWAYNNSDIYIAGDNGRIYHWDGSNWSSNLGNNDDFVDSWGDATHVYFLDDDGDVFRYTRSPLQLDPLLSPNPINPDCPGNIDYNGFTNDGAGNFYLFGENRTPNPDEAIIFKWDGVNGSCSTPVFNTPSTDDINTISVNPDGTFTAVGDDGLVVTSPDGSTWTEVSSGGEDINAIYTLTNGSSIFGADNGSNQLCSENKPHISIAHAGSANTCDIVPVTIAFHDGSNNHVPVPYTGTINITTTTNNGDWSAINATNAVTNNGNGSASYTFAAADNGTINLGFTSSFGESLNFNVSDGTNSELFTEDPNLTITASNISTFLDTFNNPGFNNNDGTVLWSSNWIETDFAGSGPNSGNVSTGGGRLRLDDRPDTDPNPMPSAAREADLSPYTSAQLSFDFFTSGGVDTDDEAVIEISNNGGAAGSWDILETFKDINGASNGSKSYNISSYIATNTQIRFRILNRYGGSNERIEFDNIQIAANTPATCNTLHHIEFIHDGAALTCAPEQITIKACQDNASPCTPYTSEVTANLLPTGWVGGDNKTFTSATGTMIYNLQHTTAETITLNSSSSPNPVICRDAGGSVISCDLIFYDSGFIYDIPTHTSCEISATPISIRAVRKDLTTQQCVPAFQNKDRSLKVWASYSNPAPATITGTPTVTLVNGNGSYPLTSTEATAVDVNMSFVDTAGDNFETFTLNYPDAGQLTLNTKYEGTAANSDTGLTMLGNTTFVVKPAKFYVYSDDANASCISGDPTNLDCNPAFRKTGENFNLKIRAACANNAVTPNFQLNGMTITSSLIQPVSGNSTNLNVTNFNFSTADNGEHVINNQNVDEVGVFTFTASLPIAGNYLGETVIGSTLLNTSANIGRFTPDHFDTLVTHGCAGGSNFTYSGQTFTVTAIARNQNNNPTVNYREGFAGVTLSDAAPAATPPGSFANNTIPSTSFTSTGTGSGSQSNVVYTFTSKETPPEILDIRATDSVDSTISSNGFTEDTAEVRSGRTLVENAYGSELTDLAVPTKIEFYNTNGFELSTTDTCSTVTAVLTDIGTDPILIGDGSSSGQTCIWDDDGESGTANCTDAALLPGLVSSQFGEPPVGGLFNLFLKAPGQNFTGNIGVILMSPSWLKYDWDGDGMDNNDPTGTASFGLYRGDDRVIYWREVF